MKTLDLDSSGQRERFLVSSFQNLSSLLDGTDGLGKSTISSLSRPPPHVGGRGGNLGAGRHPPDPDIHLCPFQGAQPAPYIMKYCAHRGEQGVLSSCLIHEFGANLDSGSTIKSLI